MRGRRACEAVVERFHIFLVIIVDLGEERREKSLNGNDGGYDERLERPILTKDKQEEL